MSKRRIVNRRRGGKTQSKEPELGWTMDGRQVSTACAAGGCDAWTLEGLSVTRIPPVSSGDVALAISNEHIAYNIAFKLYTLVLFQLSHLSTPSSLLLVGFVLVYCCY